MNDVRATASSTAPPDAGGGAARPAVVADGLTKRYGDRTVVDGIDLDVRHGECFGLLGPNGAGKTTLLRMTLGQIPPTAGSLHVLGLPIPENARTMRERVGVVPQFDNLDPDFTVRENLLTYASYFRLRHREVRRRLPALLQFANLEGRAEAPIATLSGGMKRRLVLARALINDPELVILDEPSTGLDPQARQHIWARLRALQEEGRTLILTTHYMEEAERLCDRVAIIDAGRIIACDSPPQLIARHIEPHVFELRGGPAQSLAPESLPARHYARVGETLLLYARETHALSTALEKQVGVRFWHRPAGLEDVFLRLTGHELRDP